MNINMKGKIEFVIKYEDKFELLPKEYIGRHLDDGIKGEYWDIIQLIALLAQFELGYSKNSSKGYLVSRLYRLYRRVKTGDKILDQYI